MTSSTGTPNLAPSSSIGLPPPSPSPLSSTQSASSSTEDATPNDPLSGVPDLTTSVLTSEDDRTDALKLIADSIAQQRQSSNYALITSPLLVSIWSFIVFSIYTYIYQPDGDLGTSITTLVGTTMVILALVRMLGAGYLSAAEAINWSFLQPPGISDPSESDLLIGSKFGTEMVGALALRIEGNRKRRRSSPKSSIGGAKAAAGGGSGSASSSSSSSSGKSKALIRAWTTKYRFRGKGVGTGLLEEATRVARERAGRDVEVGFAVDHANSLRVLPAFFNGHFERSEARAVRGLQAVLGSDSSSSKRGAKR